MKRMILLALVLNAALFTGPRKLLLAARWLRRAVRLVVGRVCPAFEYTGRRDDAVSQEERSQGYDRVGDIQGPVVV